MLGSSSREAEDDSSEEPLRERERSKEVGMMDLAIIWRRRDRTRLRRGVGRRGADVVHLGFGIGKSAVVRPVWSLVSNPAVGN